MKPTIYALSTPPGRGGVAVVRVSGPEAFSALDVFGVDPVRPRVATRAVVREGRGGPALDDALILSFPGPKSFTGEDVVELHLHGGVAIVGAVLDRLSGQAGFRMAEAGEFTRRAFENDKLDLTEAEGLADLIDAETEGQRKQALRQLQGGLGALYSGWCDRLTDCLALIEAGLDFSDEDDVGESLTAPKRAALQAVLGEMDAHLRDARRGELVRNGVRVAIVGAPNVGKSSLLNALAGRDAAIVSDIAGTTRDRVDVHLDLGGFAVVLSDTAGIRETEDLIEVEGIRRARLAAAEADLVLRMGDCSAPSELDGLYPSGPQVLDIWNKRDLAPDWQGQGLGVSAQTGVGLERLEEILSERVRMLCTGLESPAISRARHRDLVAEAVSALQASIEESDAVLVAENIRAAVFSLGRIVGRVDVEDVLDRIFSTFCIGK